MPLTLDVVISPRKAVIKMSRLHELGDRLDKVRKLQNQRSMSIWAYDYWKQVEAQLQRKINITKQEIGLK